MIFYVNVVTFLITPIINKFTSIVIPTYIWFMHFPTLSFFATLPISSYIYAHMWHDA